MIIVFGSSQDEVDTYVYRLSRDGEKVEGCCTPHGLGLLLEKNVAFPIAVLLIEGKQDRWLEYRAAPCRCNLGAEQGRSGEA